MVNAFRAVTEGEISFKDQFPGMTQVCFLHANSDLWRQGGTADCVCQRIDDEAKLLEAQIILANRDLQELKDKEQEILEALQHRYGGFPEKSSDSQISNFQFMLKYPGMAQVCLMHSKGGWRGGGSQDCVCLTLAQAIIELHEQLEANRHQQNEAAMIAASLNRLALSERYE